MLAAPWVRAAYPPQEPAASLDALLRDVWAQGADKAYLLYMGKSTVPMSAASRDAFAPAMLELAQKPNVAAVVVQSGAAQTYRRPKLPTAEAINKAGFIHFIRGGARSGAITERIYINVHPDHAADVMRFIVEELLQPESPPPGGAGSGASTPVKHGVVTAKVADPAGLERRADAIVIYACSIADSDWALDRLRDFEATHEDHFLPDLPAATRPRLKGVATAAEPAASLKSGSFGTYLANVAGAAFKGSSPPKDFERFRERVRTLMLADGVDPAHPDRLTRKP